MEKKLLVVLVVVGLCSTVALALDPMGPPAAGLKQGQWSAGIDYSYSQMNLQALHIKSLSWWGPSEIAPIDIDVEVHKVYGNIGYGISDKWEAFVRLGASFSGEGKGSIYTYEGEVEADSAFAVGCGTKATFYQASPELTWGGLAQVSWTSPDGELKIPSMMGSTAVDIEIQLVEVQFALGPTWTPSKGFSIYGGPIAHFVDGELRGGYSSYSGSADLEQQTTFGGYIGAQVDIAENVPVYVEWQHTDDADAFGASAVCRF